MEWGETLNYTRHINLDVNATSAATVVKVKQGDSLMRYINVTLLQDGVQFVPDSGSTAKFRFENPDGLATEETAVIEQDGTVTVQLSAQYTEISGRCKADILISLNDGTISTAVFVVDVQKSPNGAKR